MDTLLPNLAANHVITIDRYTAPSCVNSNPTSTQTVAGYFNSNQSNGLQKREYSNELLMNCSKIIENVAIPSNTLESDSNSAVKVVSYLVPVYDNMIAKFSDILGFVGDGGNNGHHSIYTEIKFLYAHAISIAVEYDESSIGGYIQMIFPIAI